MNINRSRLVGLRRASLVIRADMAVRAPFTPEVQGLTQPLMSKLTAMNRPDLLAVAVLVLIFTRWATELWLEWLNRRHVLAHSGAVPEPFREMIEPATYSKSVQYTLAKSRLGQIEMTYDVLILTVLLFSGALSWGYSLYTSWLGYSVWALGGFLCLVTIALSLTRLPFAWYEQFHLEERFGFNMTTKQLWWTDRSKGLLIGLALGYPLLVLILKIVDWSGATWWLWAWGSVFGFQLVMMVLASVMILPLFNKFTPLPEGQLRERLFALAERTEFPVKNIQVMDGSKRSRHSNAFFTGFGRFRKVVLFDTLIQQLSIPELEAVLAHEIGHYKKKHMLKLIVWSSVSLLAGFYSIAWLARNDWFYESFGMPAGNIAVALLLFGLLSGVVSFWFSPLANFWSRRYEYQADGFAVDAMEESHSLIGALRKLSEKNLSNLTPHPFYSGFYYSHPTLIEREQAMRRA